MSDKVKRLLVTGSRSWSDRDTIRAALREAWRDLQPGPIPLVHGAATGADTIAADIWTRGGLTAEPHPADWDTPCTDACYHRPREKNGRPYCPLAGHYRNQAMVDLGADLALAFPLGESRGTQDCMKRARKAGIEVRVFQG